MWSTLAAYHPCFAASDREALEFINVQYARGAFRCWATVLHKVLTLFPVALTEGIDLKTAKRILHEITSDQFGDREKKTA